MLKKFTEKSEMINRLGILTDGCRGVICFNDIATHTNKNNGGPAAIEIETGFLMYSLIKRLKIRTVIETGTHLGFSTAWIASALAFNYEYDKGSVRGKVWTVDVESYSCQSGQLWKKLGVSSYIEPFISKSTDFDLKLVENIDMLFLDSIHSKEYVLEEFEYFMPKLARSGLIILHDTVLVPELQEAANEIKTMVPVDSHLKFRNMRGLDVLFFNRKGGNEKQ